MYSPDGFASLACALHNQCFFLTYQEPFIQLLHLFNTPQLFLLFQTIVWFALIGTTYFLSKELKTKHLFITPTLILFGTTFFIDNFIGSFENDCIGIILIMLGFIFYYKYKNKNLTILHDNKMNLITAILFFLTSLTYWLWIGYLIKIPVLISPIIEVMFWTHWSSYLILFPLMILCIISGIKYKDKIKITTMLFILFFPKLFILGLPTLIKFVDELIDKILKVENKKYYLTIILFALILGQFLRVGLYEYNSATRTIENETCVTVNDEYFLRATKGLYYTYNQIDIDEVKKCKQTKSG